MNVSRRTLKKALQAHVASVFGYTPFFWRSPRIVSKEKIEAAVTAKLSFTYRIEQEKHIGNVEQKVAHPDDANSFFQNSANTIIQQDIHPNKNLILEAIDRNPDSILRSGVFDLLRNHQDHSLFYPHECSECAGAGSLTCPTCHGSQSTICHCCSGYKTQKCKTCLGDGVVGIPFGQQTSAGYIQGVKYYDCADCRATGKVTCSSCAGSGLIRCSCVTGKITCYACRGHGALTTEQFVVVSAQLERSIQFTIGSKITSGPITENTAKFFNTAMPAQWVDSTKSEVLIRLTGPRIKAALKVPGGECEIQFAANDCSSVIARSFTEHLFAEHLRKLNGFFQKRALRKIEEMPFIQTMLMQHEAGFPLQDLPATRYISVEQAEEFIEIRRKIRGSGLSE